MISYELDSFSSARYLVECCEKFRKAFETDIIYGRYTVDGCSILGVQSLVGHIVGVEPQTEDKEKIKEFLKCLNER